MPTEKPNLLDACTPGPCEVAVRGEMRGDVPFGLYAFADDDDPDDPTILLADFDDVDEEEVGKEAMCANAQLFAHAYDHALLLAAVMTHRVVTLAAFDNIEVDRKTCGYTRDPFGCPKLTPELREALQQALAEDQT